MEAYLNSLTITTPFGLTFTASFANLFLLFLAFVSVLSSAFFGVKLGKVIPCMYFGLACAFFSNQNVLPLFPAESLWIPLILLPYALGGLLLFLLISFIMWLVDAEDVKMGDTGKTFLSIFMAVTGAILFAVLLYLFVTTNPLIIVLAAAAVCTMGIFNQKRIITNSHRFRTYNDLYDLQLPGYTMKIQTEPPDLEKYRKEQAMKKRFVSASSLNEDLEVPEAQEQVNAEAQSGESPAAETQETVQQTAEQPKAKRTFMRRFGKKK